MADSSLRITDGQTNFASGVFGGNIPTVYSPQNELGIPRSGLAWLENGTVRGGGIQPRTGFLKIVEDFIADTGLFQGAYMYSPLGAVPYMVLSISGRIYRANVWTDGEITEINAAFTNPAGQTKVYFLQAEEFLIIQAGDFVTLPLFWDGATMWRSAGLAGGEMPAAQTMDYYMGRIWVQVGNREYSAGDIIYGPSGTAPYALRDAILHWTEVAYLAGGGVFSVPSNAGSIRAITHTSNMDTALGQGPLIIGTRDAMYALSVPVTRTDWIAVTNNNIPLQRVIQNKYGPTSDRSVVRVNSDLFYQAYDGVRSLAWAVRYFDQWGQTPISKNENRALQFNDRAFASFSSGIEFDNRLYQTVLPFQTSVGVAHKGIMPMDFDPLSSMQQRLPPSWEGMQEGLYFMQLLQAESGGLQRAFTVVQSQETSKIQIWEMTNYSKTDQGDVRIKWYVEWPAYTWGNLFALKKLDSAEIWIDKLSGTVDFTLWYKPDSDPCWHKWNYWRVCSARSSCEDVENPVCYPLQEYCEGYRATMTMPQPPIECSTQVGRPSNVGYQFQVKLSVKGFCRIRGILLHAIPVDSAPFEGMVTC